MNVHDSCMPMAGSVQFRPAAQAGKVRPLRAIIDDPLDVRDRLDHKEKRYLRRARLSDDPTKSPWFELDDRSRPRAIEAWRTLTEG
jgi:hypothetical protein